MTASPTLRELQSRLPAEVQPHLRRASELRSQDVARDVLPSAVEGLDELLGGGLPRGALVELVGRTSCGRFTTLLAALATATGAGEAAALVDQGDQLDPRTAAALGVDLERLLWVRPRRLPDAVAAAEMLVSTGFALVALDLGLPPVRGRVPLAAWLRLARGCRARGSVALVAAPYRLSGCAAEVVVAAGGGRGRWLGAAGSPRLLAGLHTRLAILRHRGHHPEAVARTAFVVPEIPIIEVPTPTQESHEEVRHVR